MEKRKQETLEENESASRDDTAAADHAEFAHEAPAAGTTPEDFTEATPDTPTGLEHVSREEKVHVEPHLSDILAGIAIPLEEEERAREQSKLDHAIHGLLIVGLAISVSFILIGLFLDLVFQRVVPATIPDLREVFSRVISLRPSGFLSLGLLVLIATPVVRVVGSFIAFLYERDWRYAVVTFLVLLVVTLSIVLGKG